jgi:hypothetical protein
LRALNGQTPDGPVLIHQRIDLRLPGQAGRYRRGPFVVATVGLEVSAVARGFSERGRTFTDTARPYAALVEALKGEADPEDDVARAYHPQPAVLSKCWPTQSYWSATQGPS